MGRVVALESGVEEDDEGGEVSRDERFLRGVNKASAAHSHSLSLGWKLLWAALMAG